MEKENSLTYPPQRRGTEFVDSSVSLYDSIRQSRSHMMNQDVGVKVCCLIAQSGEGYLACFKLRCVTQGATDAVKEGPGYRIQVDMGRCSVVPSALVAER